MARRICLADEKKRDAEVEIVSPSKGGGWHHVGPGGVEVTYDKFIKGTEAHIFEALVEKFGDPNAVSEALVEGDPEFDSELVGRRVGDSDRVWLKADGEVLYSTRVLQVVETPDGEEKAREEFQDVEATVGNDITLPWSGRLFSVEDVIRRFVLSRKLQLRHVNGLTYDFLYDIAKKLHENEKMLFVGSGPKGTNPLIFQTNGSPYRGFLHGQVDGEGFSLVLHLSNLELKGLSK